MRETISAEEQYRKYPELKREAVKELTDWMSQNPEFPVPTELLVIRFLFSCYFNMENAKKCVKCYYSIRLDNGGFFRDRDILNDDLQAQLDVVQYGVIPQKDPNGYVVALHRLQVFDAPRYVFPHSCRLLAMLTDALLHKEGNMLGFVIIFDMQGVSLGHLFRLKLSVLKLFFQYVQEGSPVRLKSVHIVNTLPIASKIMFIIRPFINKELLKNIHFHSDNYEEIQKHVPKECLPSDYGGTQASFEQLHEDYKKWMIEYREKFIEEDEEFLQFLATRNEAREKKSSNGNTRGKLEID